ncbi:hypothetical protein GOV14_01685 [Candidatus Pacearchaeota archaeon]|nr:hypothetical protein [Candidatus Pacearchaeota archaeon]
MIYFTFLVTGIFLGLGLSIVIIGLLILALMSIGWYCLGLFENKLTSIVLRMPMSQMASNHALREKTAWKMLKKHLSNPATWKSLAYLLIKFPIGILSFVLVVVLIPTSIVLIASPIIFYLSVIIPKMEFVVINGTQMITSYWPTFIFTILGILLLFVSLHLLNGLAYASGLFAKLLLSDPKVKVKKKKK